MYPTLVVGIVVGTQLALTTLQTTLVPLRTELPTALRQRQLEVIDQFLLTRKDLGGVPLHPQEVVL